MAENTVLKNDSLSESVRFINNHFTHSETICHPSNHQIFKSEELPTIYPVAFNQIT